MHAELIELEVQLRARGLVEEADELHELVDEAEALERPASWLQRMRGKVGGLAANQWGHVQQELSETQEVYALLRGRARGEIQELDPVQREKIRAQLLDLFKVVPGSALAVANFVAPIPCSSWLTPALLLSLGLMPSSWKEAHIEHRLRRMVRKLRERGQLAPAGEVQVILGDIETRAHQRERMASIATDGPLLGLFDRNADGTLDAREQAALHATMDRTIRMMRKRWSARVWFLCADGDVSGPFTLPDIDALGCGEHTLLCRAGKRPWVPLAWVLREVEDIDRGNRRALPAP
jgi:hypothetical protein